MNEAAINKEIDRLGRVWSLRRLRRSVTIEYSDKMTKSLGRCVPARGLIRLSAALQSSNRELLRTVLVHECAHVAVYLKHGGVVKPHGEEWRELMRVAGYEPSVRLRAAAPKRLVASPATRSRRGRSSASKTPANSRQRVAYEHRCPVCQAARIARTRARRWRCTDCVEAGLDGEMVVTRLEPQAVKKG